MPPFAYLEGSPQNIYAMQNLGSTFSNAVLGMAHNRMQMQHMAAQEALAQQQQALREREFSAQLPIMKAQESSYQAQAAYHQARAALEAQQQGGGQMVGRLAGQMALPPEVLANIVRDPGQGAQMMTDLRQAGVAPQGAFQMQAPQGGIPKELLPMIQAAVQGQYSGMAATSPGSSATRLEPVKLDQYPQVNRFTGVQEYPADPGVITPYQTGQLGIQRELRDETARHDQATEEEMRQYHILHTLASGSVDKYGDLADPAVINSLNQLVQRVYPKKPTQGKARVSVRGPKGETGTIEQGDILPPGWITQ